LLQGHAVTLAFKVATQMLSSQYGYYSCEIVVKFDFKSQSYGPDTILLQGDLDLQGTDPHLRATCRLNMVIIFVKYFQNLTSNNKVMGWTRFCCKVAL